jgi:hypothetical protein
LFFSSTTYL